MRIFCELRSSYPSPAGTRKNTKQWAKCPLVLYAKPSNKRFIIPLQKTNCYLQLLGYYFVGKSIQKSPDSVCEDDVNIEQNARAHYMRNHWMRKKKYIYILFWLLFSGKSIQNILQFSHSCSFWICRYSPCCKPVKPGHYIVLRPRILRVLLNLYGRRHNSGMIIPFIASIFFTSVKCTCLK